MGAPDFSRRSFTNFASIFSLTVVISLFLVSQPLDEELHVHQSLVLAYQRVAAKPRLPHRRCQKKSVAVELAATLVSLSALAVRRKA
jgi:hypothetical protein